MTRDQYIEQRKRIAWLGLVMLLMLLAVMSAERDACPLNGTCAVGEDGAVGCSADGQFLATISPLLSSGGLRALSVDRPLQESRATSSESSLVKLAGEALPTLNVLSVAPKTSPPAARC